MLHLLLMPIAGVSDDDGRVLVDAGGLELALRGVERRLEVSEVRAVVITSAAMTTGAH
jgi:hypothetical protein